MQSLLDDEEEVLEALDKLFVNCFIIPSLGVYTEFREENLEATSERAGEGPYRVVHLAYKTRADPTSYLDGCCVHLGQVGTSGCALDFLKVLRFGMMLNVSSDHIHT